MFLSYADESGKPNLNDGEHEYVLASITLHEREFKRVEALLNQVKLRYSPEMNPSEIEIHAMDIISGKRQYHGLPVKTRISTINDVLSIVTQVDCAINCVVIRKNLMEEWTSDEIDYIAFKFLFERLCMTLDEYNNEYARCGKDIPQFGIVFMDHIQNDIDTKIKEKIRRFMSCGTDRVKNKYIIEDIVFVDSKYRSLSQIIDCIAYVVRRYHRSLYNSNTTQREKATYHDMFSIIQQKIRGQPNRCIGGVGLKVFTKSK